MTSLLRLLCFALLCAVLPSATLPAQEPLRVVATVPDIADIAKVIGGERVEVTCLTKGSENMHNVRVRPSMMVAIRKADAFLQSGIQLESTWIPSLLLAARNSKLKVGEPGFINCGEGWEAIQVPKSLSRKGGDLHPAGNPHFNLDPAAGEHIARRICAGLSALDPLGAETYEAHLETYLKTIAEHAARWKALVEGLKGQRVAVYHQEFNYLAKYAGIEVVISVEPKPGIPPTPRDVARVVNELRDKKVEVILTAAWSNNRTVADIAAKSGARVLELPSQVGGATWAKSWIEMIDGTLERLRAGFELPPLPEPEK
jgi:zinc/manganese transport system substrate-binding protein